MQSTVAGVGTWTVEPGRGVGPFYLGQPVNDALLALEQLCGPNVDAEVCIGVHQPAALATTSCSPVQQHLSSTTSKAFPADPVNKAVDSSQTRAEERTAVSAEEEVKSAVSNRSSRRGSGASGRGGSPPGTTWTRDHEERRDHHRTHRAEADHDDALWPLDQTGLAECNLFGGESTSGADGTVEEPIGAGGTVVVGRTGESGAIVVGDAGGEPTKIMADELWIRVAAVGVQLCFCGHRQVCVCIATWVSEEHYLLGGVRAKIALASPLAEETSGGLLAVREEDVGHHGPTAGRGEVGTADGKSASVEAELPLSGDETNRAEIEKLSKKSSHTPDAWQEQRGRNKRKKKKMQKMAGETGSSPAAMTHSSADSGNFDTTCQGHQSAKESSVEDTTTTAASSPPSGAPEKTSEPPSLVVGDSASPGILPVHPLDDASPVTLSSLSPTDHDHSLIPPNFGGRQLAYGGRCFSSSSITATMKLVYDVFGPTFVGDFVDEWHLKPAALEGGFYHEKDSVMLESAQSAVGTTVAEAGGEGQRGGAAARGACMPPAPASSSSVEEKSERSTSKESKDVGGSSQREGPPSSSASSSSGDAEKSEDGPQSGVPSSEDGAPAGSGAEQKSSSSDSGGSRGEDVEDTSKTSSKRTASDKEQAAEKSSNASSSNKSSAAVRGLGAPPGTASSAKTTKSSVVDVFEEAEQPLQEAERPKSGHPQLIREPTGGGSYLLKYPGIVFEFPVQNIAALRERGEHPLGMDLHQLQQVVVSPTVETRQLVGAGASGGATSSTNVPSVAVLSPLAKRFWVLRAATAGGKQGKVAGGSHDPEDVPNLLSLASLYPVPSSNIVRCGVGLQIGRK